MKVKKIVKLRGKELHRFLRDNWFYLGSLHNLIDEGWVLQSCRRDANGWQRFIFQRND